jgi:hypothetical protein
VIIQVVVHDFCIILVKYIQYECFKQNCESSFLNKIVKGVLFEIVFFKNLRYENVKKKPKFSNHRQRAMCFKTQNFKRPNYHFKWQPVILPNA